MTNLNTSSPQAASSTSGPGYGPSPLARKLAYAGLLPFVGGAFLTWIVRPDAHPYVVDALSKYAALIVSFLAGIHWGLVLPQSAAAVSKPRLVWGVTVCLLAWVAAIMPAYSGLVILGALLVGCYLVDRLAYPHFNAAPWLTLRFRLTLVSSLSCFIAATGT